jgi:hypothetical protein
MRLRINLAMRRSRQARDKFPSEIPLRRPHFRFRQLRTCLPHWLGPLSANNGHKSRVGKTVIAMPVANNNSNPLKT